MSSIATWSASDGGAGLDMNLELYLGILTAVSMGDILNEIAYQIRPFEVVKGETDRVLKDSMDDRCDS